MATSIAIEEESGTGSGRFPEHNGYYAGDFWASTRRARPATSGIVALVTADLAGQWIGTSTLAAGTLKDAV